MRYLVVTALLAILASCLSQSDEEIRTDLEKTSSFTQELSVCASSCDQPTYNGVPVSCASNYGCYSDGGGAYCWQGSYWQNVNCVPPVECGNGICESGESANCPQDCDYCGNGYCGPNESEYSCSYDCGGGGGCYYSARYGWICNEIP